MKYEDLTKRIFVCAMKVHFIYVYDDANQLVGWGLPQHLTSGTYAPRGGLIV